MTTTTTTTTSTTSTTTTTVAPNPFTIASLTSELNNDLAGMGYAALIANKIPDPIIALINAGSPSTPGTSPGVGAVGANNAIPGGFTLTPQQFFGSPSISTPLFVTLPGLSAAIQAGWANIFNYVLPYYGSYPLAFNDTDNLQSLISGMVATGLLTQAQANALNSRNGSRAEVLWGAGTIVTRTQVNTALGWTGN
jgi:hypothetical protein